MLRPRAVFFLALLLVVALAALLVAARAAGPVVGGGDPGGGGDPAAAAAAGEPRGGVVTLFHGTTAAARDRIRREGFGVEEDCLHRRGCAWAPAGPARPRRPLRSGRPRPPPPGGTVPCACPMMGPGVYLARLDKATRYAARDADGRPRPPAAEPPGVLRCRVDLGRCAVAGPGLTPPGDGPPGVDHCGAWAARFDSVFVPAGVAGLRRPEWCVRDPRRVVAEAWAPLQGPPGQARLGPWAPLSSPRAPLSKLSESS
jgi:hypothetical protein